ncbi:hypothetical protein BSNK01_16260 [Bacillaceae bacterium]
MFKKMMAKLGVGSAKVDLVLNKPSYALGEVIEGSFHIEGGTVEQRINKLDVELLLRVTVKGREFTKTAAAIPVTSSFVIRPGEKKTLPFSYPLPMNLPISRYNVAYFLLTHLDIAGGVDHHDRDELRILPPARFENILRALERLGFREKAESGKFNGYSQEFAFFPTVRFKEQVRELEFEASIEERGIRLLLELDLLPSFARGERELKREIYLANGELENVSALTGRLETVVAETLQSPASYAASLYRQRYAHVPHGHVHGGLTGAMGSFAAGMLGGMLLEELLDETMEGAWEAGSEEAAESFGDGGLGDLFGGFDDVFGGGE